VNSADDSPTDGSETQTKQRTPKQIIDQAIRENKFSERLLYTFAALFVLCGMFALTVGIIKSDASIALLGAVAGLFFPAMRQAREIRRENIAIRLLELPASKAETAREAAETLREFFELTFQKPAEKSKREN
jgi:hypothetical protein